VPVTGFLIEKDGSAASADSHPVQRPLDKGDLLWFDLYTPDADELGPRATVFGLHHLAIEARSWSSGWGPNWPSC
jgi:Mg2+ and Co2+ transporter CorA